MRCIQTVDPLPEGLRCTNALDIARKSKHAGFDKHDDHFDCSCDTRIHGPSRVKRKLWLETLDD